MKEEARALRTAYVDLFLLAGRLRAGEIGRAQPAGLRDWARSQLRQERRRLQRLQVEESVLEDAQLAVIGLLDEAARSAPAAFATGWDPPLQQEYYKTTEAGTQVFERLGQILDDPLTPVELLELYERCLLFGFQGKYLLGDQASTWSAKLDELGEEIRRRRHDPPPWAPALLGLPPPPPAPFRLGPLPIAGMALGLILLVGLALTIKLHLGSMAVAEELRSAAKAAAMAPRGER